ncbi:hypothetical protein [Streptomyces goshikiensis]|uniref:hypothetical protein n=1 Tax=Streptomyces goshikiensis TaxID=1942 RepID=UPI003320CEF9
MAKSEVELLALLREFDDPERLERPLHYDRAATGPPRDAVQRQVLEDLAAAEIVTRGGRVG